MTGAEKVTSHIANRLGDLIKSLRHDWIVANDGALSETFDKYNKQLDEIRTAIGQAIAERHVLEKERKALDNDIAGLDQQAEDAVRDGREDLARMLVRQKVRLTKQHEKAGETLASLEEMIDRFDTLLRDFRDIADTQDHNAQLHEIEAFIRQISAASHDEKMSER